MNNFFTKFFKGDTIIWAAIVLLSIISVIEVYSSTGALASKFQDGNTSHYILKHSTLLLLGFGVIWIIHNIHYKYFSYAAKLALPLSVVLLVITIFGGSSINHASRWLTIPIIGLSFQPSEFAKIALIVYAARKLSAFQSVENPPAKAFKPIMLWTLTVCGLIAPEDFSSAILIGAIILTLLFIGRTPASYLIKTVLVGIACVVVLFLTAPKLDNIGIFHRANTWITRIQTFSDTESATKDASYQADQAKIAISTGGVMGKFFGNSRQSNYLPHPYSDFIYAIIVEEGGLFAGVITLLLYIILLYRALAAAVRCKTSFPLFLISGLAIAFTLQAFAHMFVCIGILPVTGQTLPFVSMGGTSIFFTAASLGMILSVTNFALVDKGVEPEDNFEPNEYLNENTEVVTDSE